MSFSPGRPFQVQALNKTWTLSRISLDMIFAFRDWIKSRLGDPLAGPIAKIFDRLPLDEQIARVKDAERIGNELACFSMQSELAQTYLRKEEGQAHWAQLWLKEFHPDLDLATAFAIFVEASEQLAKAFEVTQGQIKTPGQGMGQMQVALDKVGPGSGGMQGNSQAPAPAMPAA